MNNAQTPKQKLSESLQQVCQQLWEQARTVFATKTEVAAIPGANLELASDSDAEDIWDGYTFSTTD